MPSPKPDECEICGATEFTLSKGPGRIIGPFAKNFVATLAPVPDDLEIWVCSNEHRQYTDEIKHALRNVEQWCIIEQQPTNQPPSQWSLRAGNPNDDIAGFEVRETKHGAIYLEARPAYCDRGRYSVKVFPLHGHDCKSCDVDDQDMFPRYYFDKERAKLEVQAWVDARGWDR
jgi:hypothetical protein